MVEAAVGQQDLQQGDAAAGGGPAVADPAGSGAADASSGTLAVAAARGTGNIVFGAVGQDFQPLLQVQSAHFRYDLFRGYINSLCIGW